MSFYNQKFGKFFLLAAFLSSAALLPACGSKKKNDNPQPPVDPIVLRTLPSTIEIVSDKGCYIDDDCKAGMFCFQGMCTAECQTADDCGGADCNENGRCVAKANKAGEGSPVLPETLPDVTVIEADRTVIEAAEGDAKVTYAVRTDKDIAQGAILYRLDIDGEGTTAAKRAEGERDFHFEIPAGLAAADASHAAVQTVNLVSSIGNWTINVIPKVKTAGRYEGSVVFNQFGGAELPVEMAFEVEPSYAESLNDVTSMKVALPSSLQELFSPESVEATADGTKWVRLTMKKEQAQNCVSEQTCWSAAFSTNDFHQGTSDIFGTNSLNRSIRIEVNSLDRSNKRIQGYLRDTWKGLYRKATQGSNMTWADVTAEGAFLLTRMDGLKKVTPIEDHTPAESVTVGEPANTLSLARCTQTGAYDATLAADVCPAAASGLDSVDGDTLAACGNALASALLDSDDLTSKIVLCYMSNASASGGEHCETPDGLTFADFLKKCAAKDGYCVEDPKFTCAGDILARAYQLSSGSGATAAQVLSNWQSIVRESYLGPQLAAFQNDVNARIDWLQSTEVPQILASAFTELNTRILTSWENNVLNTHFSVLGSQFTPHSMETLARETEDEAISSTRTGLLGDASSTWEGAMTALTTASARWNELYTDTITRAAKTSSVRKRMIDLYVAALVLSDLNKAGGNSSANASFGSGFRELLLSLEQLSRSFNDLVFMRDAEVVVPRSVDPMSDRNTLISERKTKAEQAVNKAYTAIDAIIEKYQNQQLSQETVVGELNAQLLALAGDLADICGLPSGCTAQQFLDGKEGCGISTALGECGVQASGEAAAGEAGTALRAYATALLDVESAKSAYQTYTTKLQLETESAEGFAKNIQAWDRQRREASAKVQQHLDAIAAIDDAQLAAEVAVIKESMEKRAKALADQAARVAEWSTIRINGANHDYKELIKISALNSTANALNIGGEYAADTAEALKEASPEIGQDSFGKTTITQNAGGVAMLAGATVKFLAATAANILESAALGVSDALEHEQALREAKMENQQDLAELAALKTENELANMADQLRLREIQSEQAKGAIEDLIASIQENLELDMAQAKEMQELADRQTRLKQMLAERQGYVLAAKRAELKALQVFNDYLSAVQRAQLTQVRFDRLKVRHDNVANILTSPTAIFAFANRLQGAEDKLANAKASLYDYLAAIEYYAVRPFIDQRRAILLARSTTQLEAIAADLDRLVDNCGGTVNKSSVELSLRDDILKVGFDTETMTAAERFRAILDDATIGVDTLIRYSSDANVGQAIAARRAKGTTFQIDLNTFANLASSCNAKIDSLEIMLVGEGLNKAGSGTLRPTVSFIYDGASQLRSCQPDIEAVVSTVTPGSTSYGAISYLKTDGRSVSPIAGVNEYTSAGSQIDTANYSLQGMPLASTYSVLIDTTVGENPNVDWSKLEDIKLKLNWVYQDNFTKTSQCY